MKISKTRFIRFIKSKRMEQVEGVYRDNAVAIDQYDESIESLMDQENWSKKQVVADSIYEKYFDDDPNFDIDLLEEINDPQLEIMMPYYDAIEALSERKITNQFGGEVIYNQDTFKQKYFQRMIDGYYFFAFLDCYQEDQKHIRIIETKATTSKKFLDLMYKDDDGNKYGIFAYSPEGVLCLREDLGLSINEDYQKKKQKLFDKESKQGKYVYDIAYQKAVVSSAIKSDKPVKYYLSVLNAEYVYDGKKDHLDKPIYTDDIMTLIDLTSVTNHYLETLNNDLKQVIYRLNHMDLEMIQKEEYLLKKMEVLKIKNELKMDPRLAVSHPIFEYHLGHHGFKVDKTLKYTLNDLVDMGFYQITDVPYEWLHRKNYQIQYDVVKNMEPYMNKERMKSAILDLKYPLYHLDFETFPCPLPRYFGEKPYTQSVFQFSLHIESAPGQCDKDSDHYEFLAYNHQDLRIEMLDKLTTWIKDDGGDIIAYNYGFEKARMKELAHIFPKYQPKLSSFIDRTYDLMHLLKGNKNLFKRLGFSDESEFNYYHYNQKGSFSIKKILPLFTNLNYQDLPIGNGVEALVAYAKFPIMSKQVFEQSYQDLLKYCKQDTWAMVAILEGLRKEVGLKDGNNKA